MHNAFTPIPILAMMFGLVAMIPIQSGSKSTQEQSGLRNILCRDAWTNGVNLGPIAIEQRTLVFYDDGTIRQQIADDTGLHDLQGKWLLEQAADQTSLMLEGRNLLIKGRYVIVYDAKKDVIELRYDDAHPALIFERLKGFQRTATVKPK